MRVAACIASGPSLTASDCEKVAEDAEWIIACNESYRLATMAHAIYAGDYTWWDRHYKEVPAHLEKWTCSATAAGRFHLNFHQGKRPGKMYNSGQRAIELAISKGFDRIILLGYDCSVSRGTHWHGDHRHSKNPDMDACARWQEQFAAIETGGVEILNCSRESELKAFPRMALEAAIVL